MKPYPKYKDSGVEWIGEIPEHWSIAPIRWTTEVFSGGTPNKEKPEYWNSNDIPWLASGEVNKKTIKNAESYISHEGLKNSSAKWVKPQSILMALAGQGKTKGMVARLEINATTNQSLAAIIPDSNKLSYNFIYYYLASKYLQIRGLVGDDARDGLNLELIKSIQLPLPDLLEQKAIASFLDQKTAQIDKLIQSKQKLIELLKEERIAIINQAVTKGINPKAKMKDSGVEWIGEIPEHWEVKKLKYVAEINPPKGLSKYTKDDKEEVVFLPMERVSEEGIVNSEFRKPVCDLWNGFTYFKKNDVILAKITPCFENGKGAILEKLPTEIGFGSTEFHVLRAKENSIPKFLYMITRTNGFMKNGEASMYGAGGQKRVPTEFLTEFSIALPDKIEQESIVENIESQTSKIDLTLSRIEKEIELLQEYRTALISEVVTGKVKVT